MKQLTALYNTARRDNIMVDCFELPFNESMSLMDDNGNCFIAIDPYSLTSEEDELLKLAHELGHCETGAFYNRYSLYDIRARHEARAERWAFCQLLPKRYIEAAARKGYLEPWEIAEFWNLPEPFVARVLEFYCSIDMQN